MRSKFSELACALVDALRERAIEETRFQAKITGLLARLRTNKSSFDAAAVSGGISLMLFHFTT